MLRRDRANKVDIKQHGTLKIICGYFATTFGSLKVCYFFSWQKK